MEISKLSFNPSVQSSHDNSQSNPIFDFLVEGYVETSDDFTTAADYINTSNEESFSSSQRSRLDILHNTEFQVPDAALKEVVILEIIR